MEGETAPEHREISVAVRPADVEASKYVAMGGDADRGLGPADRRVRELERENERLAELLDVLGHDLRNHLAVAEARLELARQGSDVEDLDAVDRSHQRMAELLDDLLAARNEGFGVGETEPVRLATCAQRAWTAVESGAATLEIESDMELVADAARFRQLLENLFGNAVEHGSANPGSQTRQDGVKHVLPDPRDGLTITVGTLSSGSGFFVEDDGCGLPTADPDRLFESGVSTTEVGTGLGLSIVADVVEGHDWIVDATESTSGGARFEVSGVERPAPTQDGQRTP